MKDDRVRQPSPADPLTTLGQVAGELVHDLANEVQVLQGWAMLARGELAAGNPPVAELQRVLDISSRLGRMLRDMLETVSGQKVSPELVFDPHALTEETVNERVKEMGSLDVRYRCHLPPEVRVAGRASFWSRAVTNLLVNASRHAFLAIRVTLSLREEPGCQRLVVLRVEDDGPGVSPDDQAEIFRPFWRGTGGGAGLGLSSVAWSVRELGGSVRYATDSSLGGAAFEVVVPAAVPLPLPPAPAPALAAQFTGIRLLLIDDDKSVRLALNRLLARAGAEVLEIDPVGLPEAFLLDRIKGVAPDVILLDVHLGDRGGIALWRRLAVDAPELASRVAFVTGLVAGDPTWNEAGATGQPVLGKPFDLSDLLQTLSRLRPSP
ncbi:MAG TPA: hybrid sensor histidine kinase/response regulator [Longimicrobiaceae bacterium]